MPKDRFVRKAVRTLGKIQKRGLDPVGAISSMADDQINHVGILKSKAPWHTSSFSVLVSEAVPSDPETGALILDLEKESRPADRISWRDNTGIISPDGKERMSAANALLHEIGHSYYNKIDPYGKVAELNKLIEAQDWDGITAFEEQMAKDVGKFDDYAEKWIVENLEVNWNKEWKRKSHSEGYFLKTWGGSFSRKGREYGKNGKIGSVRDLKPMK